MVNVHDKVTVHGKLSGVVTSVHKGGKRVGVLLSCGKSTFTSTSNVKVVTA